MAPGTGGYNQPADYVHFPSQILDRGFAPDHRKDSCALDMEHALRRLSGTWTWSRGARVGQAAAL